MPSHTGHVALRRALDDLDELAVASLRPRIAELRRRLRDDRFRVLVVGEAKRGKSTFVNALLRRDVLPTGITPLTAIATTVGYGDHEEVRLALPGGREESRPLTALPGLVTERGNPQNRLGLRRVEVRLPAPLLAEGVELVDTPGTGSVYEHNTVEAESALQAMDAAVFVLSADPPISARRRSGCCAISTNTRRPPPGGWESERCASCRASSTASWPEPIPPRSSGKGYAARPS